MSKLSDVLESFGFETQEKQIALLENLSLAGYFEDKKLWQMVALINYDKATGKQNNSFDQKIVFENLQTVCKESKGSAQYLLDNLFEVEIFDKQDVEDMVLYIGQNAFGRLYNQERIDLKLLDLVDRDREKYLKNAKILGFIDEILPAKKKYDESWIQGAAKLRMKTRIEYWRDLCAKETIDPGTVKFLTGNRELWLQIDKLPGESLEQSKEFFLHLAEFGGIKVNEKQPFETRSDNRTYLKYDESETSKITETLMAKMMFRDYLNLKIENIVEGETLAGRARPDTESGAKAAYNQFVASENFPKDCKPNIIIISNQPYCNPQLLGIEAAIAEKTGKENSFNLEVCGAANEVDVTGINSEIGSTIGQAYMKLTRRNPFERKRSPDQMMYSKRLNIKLEVGETFGQNVVTTIVLPTASQLAANVLSQSINNSENAIKTGASR